MISLFFTVTKNNFSKQASPHTGKSPTSLHTSGIAHSAHGAPVPHAKHHGSAIGVKRAFPANNELMPHVPTVDQLHHAAISAFDSVNTSSNYQRQMQGLQQQASDAGLPRPKHLAGEYPKMEDPRLQQLQALQKEQFIRHQQQFSQHHQAPAVQAPFINARTCGTMIGSRGTEHDVVRQMNHHSVGDRHQRYSRTSSQQPRCLACGKDAQFVCSRCRSGWYCSERCQVSSTMLLSLVGCFQGRIGPGG